MIFSRGGPETLCEYFDFKCCQNSFHSDDCVRLWNDLKNYSYTNLIPKEEKLPEIMKDVEVLIMDEDKGL